MTVLVAVTAVYAVVVGAVIFAHARADAQDVRRAAISTAGAELGALAAFAPPISGAAEQDLTAADRQHLDLAVARLARPHGDWDLRLWRRNGTVLYEWPLNGEPDAAPGVQRALLGKDWTVERPATETRPRALVTYHPVMAGGRLHGVVELAQPLKPVLDDEASERDGVYVFFGITVVLVWLALLPALFRLARLVVSAWNPLRRRQLRQIRLAIERGDLELHYQPKVDIATGDLDGVEALVRWRRDGELVPPGSFLGLVEGSALIRPLTLWVLDTALAQAREWDRTGRPVNVAVNLFPRSLADPRVVLDVGDALQRHGVDACCLTLEVTETAVFEDESSVGTVLVGLAGLGVTLSVDDFGTGYSSLARVTRHPFTELKIDRSFVMELTREERPIVATMVRLAKTLDFHVVAEGVEDEPTLNALRALGCDVAQGFFLGRPGPPDALHDVTRALPAISRTARSVHALLEEVRESLGLDATFVAEFGDEHQSFRWTSGDSESFGTYEGATQALCDSYCDRVVSGVFPNLITDAQGDERTRSLPVTGLRDIGAYIGVPLHHPDGSFYGTLCGLSHSPMPDMTGDDVAVLADFADRISPLLGSANLAVAAR